jgi:NitT/TauT family transport system ATP-binding protein
VKRHLRVLQFEKASQKERSLLEVKNLEKVFHAGGGYQTVLKNVWFSVIKGELICILGRSGCGKTTLLNLLAGFLKPSRGTICLGGKPVYRPGPDRCVVFQEDTLFPWLTVQENIAFGLKGKGFKRDEVLRKTTDFLALVGLTDFKDYLPAEISGGMRQRVALARVLILAPQVLLMDEPFAALDAQTRSEMQGLLLRLWEEFRHTVIFVTHDVDEAVMLADRVFVMGGHPGRIQKKIHIHLKRPRRREDSRFAKFSRMLYESLSE